MMVELSLIDKKEGVVFHCIFTEEFTSALESADIYMHVWNPSQVGARVADDMWPVLSQALSEMEGSASFYTRICGGAPLYSHLYDMLERYAQTCADYPDARIKVEW